MVFCFQGSSTSFIRKIYSLFQQEHSSNQGWSLYVCRSSHHYCPRLHFFVTSFLPGLSEDWYENTSCMLFSHLSQGENHFAFINSMNAFEVFKEFTCTLPWLESYLKIDESQVSALIMHWEVSVWKENWCLILKKLDRRMKIKYKLWNWHFEKEL